MRMAQSDSSIRITNTEWLWAAIGFPLAVFFAWQSVAHIARGGNVRETVVVTIAALFCAGVALLQTEWSDFRFDKISRAVSWRRGGLIRSSGGVIPFDHIGSAVVQFKQGMGDPKAPKDYYRVALSTEDGIVPLTTSYAGGRVNDTRCREIRTAINQLLDLTPESEDDQDIRELDESGNRAGAISFIQARHGLDTNAAYARLEQICRSH